MSSKRQRPARVLARGVEFVVPVARGEMERGDVGTFGRDCRHVVIREWSPASFSGVTGVTLIFTSDCFGEAALNPHPQPARRDSAHRNAPPGAYGPNSPNRQGEQDSVSHQRDAVVDLRILRQL